MDRQIRYYVAPEPPTGRLGALDLAAQSATGGALSLFLISVVLLFGNPNPYNFLAGIYFPIVLVVGAQLGLIAGGAVWFTAKYLLHSEHVISRVGIMIALLVVSGALLFLFVGLMAPEILMMVPALMMFGALIGMPAALLVGSRLRVASIFAYGVIGQRATTVIEGKPAASVSSLRLAGMPLRLAAVIGLLGTVFIMACCWDGRNADGFVLGFGSVIFYFAATIYFSFSSHHLRILICAGLLLNGFVAISIVPLLEHSGGVPAVLVLLWMGFGLLWAVLVATSPNTPVNSSEADLVRSVHQLHRCLGERFADWERHVTL
jgi:hypothetical protein